ncbi:MAG: CHRD domain-containing protein [Thermomicrobiales bacterium]
MGIRNLGATSAGLVLLLVAGLWSVGSVQAERLSGSSHGGRPLSADLTGAAEVPGPGDPDGSGTALITLNHGQREVCFELFVADIAPATAAHIHRGAEDVAGPVVVGLAPPTDGSSSGCIDEVNRTLIREILQNPAGFYVNVHNAEFPAGAVRGQLG